MDKRIALCLDEESRQYPDLIGLRGEALDAQDWMDVFVKGEQARQALRSDEGYREAWVVACDDVDPINLAATLKADRPDLCVRLVDSAGGGSMLSRAHTAGIDDVMDLKSLVKRYADEKKPIDSMQTETRALVQAQPLPVVAKTLNAAFVMPVVSGSGGAGKSTVSTMAALIAKSMGYKTLLLDYDLQFGDVAEMLSLGDALTIDEALSNPAKLDQELQRNSGFMVLSAPPRLETAESVVSAIPGLVDALAPSFDVIVANTGAAWAEQHAMLLERSSAALFLIDQRASSIRACKHALGLCARCGIATGQFQFVLNRCSKNAPMTSMDVSCALDGAFVHELSDGGREVEDCLGGGAAMELLASGNELRGSLERLLAGILPDAEGRQSVNGDTRKNGKHRGLMGGRRRSRKHERS